MQKSLATSTKGKNCGTQQVRWLYLTKKKKQKKNLRTWLFETVKLLSELFSSKTSLFHKRWRCRNLTKRDSDDYLGFASVVKKKCDDFQQGESSGDDFKYLIFAQGLVSAKDAEIRRRVLSKLEKEPDLTLQKLAKTVRGEWVPKKTQKNIEESGVAYVRKVKHRSQSYSPVKERKKYDYPKFQYRQMSNNQKTPPSTCYRCGKDHWAKDCPYCTKKKCQNCDKFGHKVSQCWNWKIIKNRVRHTKSEDYKGKVVRKYITVKVLNKSVRFQLDAGSDLSMINLQTWRKLDRPIIKLTSKTARTVRGDKIKLGGEIIIPISLNFITKKLSLRTQKICLDRTGFWNLISKINQIIRFAKK